MPNPADQSLDQHTAPPGANVADPPLCVHLAPVLRHLLAQGATITGSAAMAWSRNDLEVMLDHGPVPADIPSELLTPTGASIWSNLDPHYPLAHGLLCAECRHSLGWPAKP